MTERRNDYQVLVAMAERVNAPIVARSKGRIIHPNVLGISIRAAVKVKRLLGERHPEPAVWRTN